MTATKLLVHARSAVLFGAALCVVSFSGSAAQTPAPAQPARGPAQAPLDAPLPALLKDYTPVTSDRLKNPEPGNWLQIRGTYNGWGYSALDQITSANVKQLELAWVFSTGAVAAHEAAPLVNNGVMYLAAPGNQVIAIDAKTGTQMWRYRRELPSDAIAMHRVSRGVALYDDKVFFASNAAVLVALDARTGREVWTATVEDNRKGYYLTAAPVVADGKVMVGVSGGEFGIRGFVAAYDAGTGKEAWRTFTIPAPGEPGHETWPQGDEWKTGGAPTWVSGNYDPETNLLYWGVGTAARGWASSGLVTICTCHPRLRLMRRLGRSSGTFNTTRTSHSIGTRSRHRC